MSNETQAPVNPLDNPTNVIKLNRAQQRAAKKAKLITPEAPKLIKLDIACGQNKQEGFVGIDIAACEGVDVVHDLTVTPWPITDSSVEFAFSSHFIEHLTPTEFITFMHELYRVLAPGAQAQLIAPYYASARAIQDPTHKQFVSEYNFLYYNQDWLKTNKLDHYGITCDFDFNYGYQMTEEWAGRNEEMRLYAIRHYINVVNDIVVTVTSRKPA